MFLILKLLISFIVFYIVCRSKGPHFFIVLNKSNMNTPQNEIKDYITQNYWCPLDNFGSYKSSYTKTSISQNIKSKWTLEIARFLLIYNAFILPPPRKAKGYYLKITVMLFFRDWYTCQLSDVIYTFSCYTDLLHFTESTNNKQLHINSSIW